MRALKICFMKSCGTVAPHIIADIADAFIHAGHSALIIDFESEGVYAANEPDAKAAVASRIVARMRAFAPDFAISYGMGGVVSLPGEAINLFEALKLPYLLLFYDAPLDLAEKFKRLKGSQLLRVLCWDRRYLPWLEGQGVERLIHQPLGTNVRVFGAAKPSNATGISFVGSLPADALKRGLPGSTALQAFAKGFIELKLKEPCRPFRELLDARQAALPESDRAAFAAFRGTPGFVRFFSDLMSFADALYRRESMRILKGFQPTVYGGGAWLDAGLDGVSLKGPVAYGAELASLYASSMININLTNSHLEGAVNQRPFDCAAAGGFLLSDFREQMPELFDPETEIPTFRSLEELRELAARFSRDAEARRRMAESARRRAVAEHSWDVRVAGLAKWFLETL